MMTAKKNISLYNGRLINETDLFVSTGSQLLVAGTGLFETALFQDGRLFFWEKHLLRMQNSLTYLKKSLKTAMPERSFVESFLAAQNCSPVSRIRLTAFPGSDNNQWDWLLTSQDYLPPDEDFCLKISDDMADYELLKHKTLNYWPNLIAIQSAESANTETARRNRFGNINEGCRTNILLVNNDVLLYTGYQNNYLPGIMQQILLSNHRAAGFKSIRALDRGFNVEDLQNAGQIVLTNSLLPVTGVNRVEVNGSVITKTVDGHLISRLKKLVAELD